MFQQNKNLTEVILIFEDQNHRFGSGLPLMPLYFTSSHSWVQEVLEKAQEQSNKSFPFIAELSDSVNYFLLIVLRYLIGT